MKGRLDFSTASKIQSTMAHPMTWTSDIKFFNYYSLGNQFQNKQQNNMVPNWIDWISMYLFQVFAQELLL
jgi:hypothetical protein